MSESQSRKCFDSKLTGALIQCLRGDNRTEHSKCYADFALDFSSLDFFLVFKFFFPTFFPTFFSTFFPTFLPTFFSTFFPTSFRKKNRSDRRNRSDPRRLLSMHSDSIEW